MTLVIIAYNSVIIVTGFADVKQFILPHTRYESLLFGIYRYIPVYTGIYRYIPKHWQRFSSRWSGFQMQGPS